MREGWDDRVSRGWRHSVNAEEWGPGAGSQEVWEEWEGERKTEKMASHFSTSKSGWGGQERDGGS